MAISYKISVIGNLIKVVANGFDDDLATTMSYINNIIDTARTNKSRFVLCDDRELK